MQKKLNPSETALILIGYQNDYFSPSGILHSVVELSTDVLLHRSLDILNRLKDTPVTIISTPILFTPDYSELVEPVGILKIIKESQAFRNDTEGGKVIPELMNFGDRIIEVPGKRGLNAFSNTNLLDVLRQKAIRDVVLMGVMTPLCIESTGRQAAEYGFLVRILSDATAGRTKFEQEFYCSEIFPLYANVIDSQTLIDAIV